MVQTCSRCTRVNPPEALYCYFDGTVLDGRGLRSGPVNVGCQPFPNPFVLPSGRGCKDFDQLALACQDDTAAAQEALTQGDLAGFLGSIGRSDLARVAREAARAPNRARGLDALLAALPSKVLLPPKLYVQPTAVNLGELRVGENRHLTLRLENQGMRLLYGSMAVKDGIWLSLGPTPGIHQKLFQFGSEFIVPLHVVGKNLSASSKPLEGHVVIESNGGEITVVVRASVPVKPFPAGVLAGATSPRQIAQQAMNHPREAAVFFENGAVAQWYRENGLSYPVKGPSSSGLGAIQQYFEAHGLARPPKVELRPAQVMFFGKVGEPLQQQLEVRTQEQRTVYALASSNQPWLKVECPPPKGQLAHVWVNVPAVPDEPGETLEARVVVQANGNQRFVVPVTLTISGSRRPGAAPPAPRVGSDGIPVAIPVAPPPTALGHRAGAMPVAVPLTTAAPAAAPLNGEAAPPSGSAYEGGVRPRRRRHLLPAGLLFLVLLGMFLRDTFFTNAEHGLARGGDDEPLLIDTLPRLRLVVHDQPDRPDPRTGQVIFDHPTMRFGLVTHDPNAPGQAKRLTFDEHGRSNNTCIRLDGEEYLFGEAPGHWQEFATPLGKDPSGRERDGYRSVWNYEDRQVLVSQVAEIVPGQTSRLLDTCLVRYRVENRDRRSHRIGLRFLLDTYIGANDGVPFTLPGSTELCDTMYEFDTPGDVPDFIQALERENLSNPGTVANVQLRLGGRIEAPSRVTLGAWPNVDLRQLPRVARVARGRARGHMTLWEVPVLPMKSMHSLSLQAEADSAVVMYWPERDLQPGDSREVGFAYGLGNVASSAGGQLALTVGGSLVRGEEFSVTAYVTQPIPDQRLTLQLPDGFQLREGNAEQPVPAVPPNATRPISTVTWKVLASKAGQHSIKVVSSRGTEQAQKVSIRQRSIFD